MSVTVRHRLRLGMALGALLAIAWMGWLARPSLLPFLVGLFLAWLLVPVVDLLARQVRRWRFTGKHDRLIALIIVYVVGLGTLSGIGFVLAPWVADQTRDLFDDREEILDNLGERFQPWIDFYENRLPEEVQTAAENWFERARQNVPSMAANIINHNLATVFGFIVVPFWLFVFVKDQPKASAWFYKLFPEPVRPDVQNLMSNASRIVGRYLVRQLFLGVFVGVATVIPLLLLDIPFAVPLAVVAGVLELVTIIGPIVAAVIAIAVTLALATVGDALIVLGIYVGIQQIENYVVVPRVQGRAMDIHPALVMVLIIAAASAFGLLGVFLVLPVTAILRDSFQYIYRLLGQVPREEAVSVLTGLKVAESQELEQIELPPPEEVLDK